MATVFFNFFNYIYFPFLLLVISIWIFFKNFMYKTSYNLNAKLTDSIKLKSKQPTTFFSFKDLNLTLAIIIFCNILKCNNYNITYRSVNFFFSRYAFNNFVILLILSWILIYFIEYFFIIKSSKIQYQTFILLPITYFTLIGLSSVNLISLFFSIEIISYIFYFQFLNIYATNLSKNKSKKFFDAFLLYYWNSFLGTFILFYFLTILASTLCTFDFYELNLLSILYTSKYFFSTFLLTLALCLKLGALGFYFLKSEIYKYLRIDNVLNFTIFAIYVYLVIIYFIIHSIPFVWLYSKVYFLPILLVLSIFFFLQNITNIDNFLLFFGYSAFITSTTCLVLLY